MQLTDEQKKQVAQWVSQGLKLADVQRRLDEELGVRLTYMETRFLIDDLHLTPQDPAEPAAPEPATAEISGPGGAVGAMPVPEPGDALAGVGAGAGVQVRIDSITRPGAVVSGSVVFSDGVKAAWYMDQMGRLGLSAEQPGYRPPEGDVPLFQSALERELSKMGL